MSEKSIEMRSSYAQIFYAAFITTNYGMPLDKQSGQPDILQIFCLNPGALEGRREFYFNEQTENNSPSLLTFFLFRI